MISEIARNRGAEADNSDRVAEVTSLLTTLAAEDIAQSPNRAETVRRVALGGRVARAQIPRLRFTSSAYGRTPLDWPPWWACPLPKLNSGLASQLHDVGKVGIPDSIVLNPRLLTEDERLTMQGHTQDGFKMLDGFRLAPAQTGLSHRPLAS